MSWADATAVTSLDDWTDDAVYTIRNNQESARGVFMNNNGTFTTTAKVSGSTIDDTNTNQQFFFIKSNISGYYYMYNVGAGKFVSCSGAGSNTVTFVDIPTINCLFTFTKSTNTTYAVQNYIWYIKPYSASSAFFNITTGYTNGYNITNNANADQGNHFKLLNNGTASTMASSQYTSATTAIKSSLNEKAVAAVATQGSYNSRKYKSGDSFTFTTTLKLKSTSANSSTSYMSLTPIGSSQIRIYMQNTGYVGLSVNGAGPQGWIGRGNTGDYGSMAVSGSTNTMTLASGVTKTGWFSYKTNKTVSDQTFLTNGVPLVITYDNKTKNSQIKLTAPDGATDIVILEGVELDANDFRYFIDAPKFDISNTTFKFAYMTADTPAEGFYHIRFNGGYFMTLGESAFSKTVTTTTSDNQILYFDGTHLKGYGSCKYKGATSGTDVVDNTTDAATVAFTVAKSPSGTDGYECPYNMKIGEKYLNAAGSMSLGTYDGMPTDANNYYYNFKLEPIDVDTYTISISKPDGMGDPTISPLRGYISGTNYYVPTGATNIANNLQFPKVDGYYVSYVDVNSEDKTITITYKALSSIAKGFYKIKSHSQGKFMVGAESGSNFTWSTDETSETDRMFYYDGSNLRSYTKGTYLNGLAMTSDAASASSIAFEVSPLGTAEYGLNLKIGTQYLNAANTTLVASPNSASSTANYTNFELEAVTDLTPIDVTITGADGSITPKAEDYAGYTPIKNGGFYGASAGNLTSDMFTVTEIAGCTVGTWDIDGQQKYIKLSYVDKLQDASTEENNTVVVFPQTNKPGAANLVSTTSGTTTSYSFYNSLFNAHFIKANNTLTFGGCSQMNLNGGTDLFKLSFGTGTDVVTSSQMTLGDVTLTDLTADANATVASEKLAGKMLQATFTYTYNEAPITVVWKAILRDGSHYLRTSMDISSTADVDMYNLVPMIYSVDIASAGSTPAVNGNTQGSPVASDKIFAGLETPMGLNTVETDQLSTWTPTAWTSTYFDWTPGSAIPNGILNLDGTKYTTANVYGKRGYIYFANTEGHTVTFKFSNGTHKLNMVGVDLVDPNTGNVVYKDYHYGKTGGSSTNNVYTLKDASDGTNITAGLYVMRYFVTTKADDADNETITSTGTITISDTYANPTAVTSDLASTSEYNATYDNGTVHQKTSPAKILGTWVRDTTLPANETWNVSSVVGLVASGQARRSVACYSERERAVPWHTMTNYNSWYELNINRNNDQYYATNMNIDQCVDVVGQWKAQLYDKYKIVPDAFVFDDGWDTYGTWTFSPNFPNGFAPANTLATSIGSGIGAWLGPVGGYGTSGDYRRSYWTNKGSSMLLSNKEYYNVFWAAAKNLVKDQGYDFRFFKFDGISDIGTATGPKDGQWEAAEGIIAMENKIRKDLRSDIFFNTSVGTWASPFWFHVTDAVWRQDADWSTAGNNTNKREQWITYRDKMVYNIFVKAAPLCPINDLMTHGFILSTCGGSSATNIPCAMDNTSTDYAHIVNEMRCAFACGSGMVELYADYNLLNTITDASGNKGALWGELADCMLWQKRNVDVLPDIHWVGGSPWDGTTENVYGWAAWNGKTNKSVFTLRNGSTSEKTYKTTLREMLDIPASITGLSMQFHKAFANQAAVTGLTEDTNTDIDTKLTITLPANSVYVFDADDDAYSVKDIITSTDKFNNRQAYSIQCADTGTRGVMYSNNGTLAKNTTVDPTQSSQQWAIIKSFKYDDTYYIVNVASGKFLTTATTMALQASAADNTRFQFTTTGSGSETHPWNVWNYGKTIRMNIGSAGILMKATSGGSGATNDAGNQYEIARVDGVGFDATKAESLIYAYEYGLSSTDDLDNDRLYTFTNARGIAYYNTSNAYYLMGSNKTSTTVDATDATQQFAILKSAKGNYYFYSPVAKKFISWNTTNRFVSLTDLPQSTAAAIGKSTGTAKATYPWTIQPSGSGKCMSMSTSADYGLWNDTNTGDEGAMWAITPAGTWDSENVINLINLCENMPTTGKFYRLRGAYSNLYAQGVNVTKDGNRLSMTSDKGAASLWWYDADKYLLNYNGGMYTTNTCELNTSVGKSSSTYTLTMRGASETNYMRYNALKIANGSTYLYDNGRNSVACADRSTADGKQINWFMEEATSIPVTFKKAGLGYATFCSPVPVQIPKGVDAYVSRISGNTITLYKIENWKDDGENVIIPANTAVMLYRSGTTADATVEFPITSSEIEVQNNGFSGTIAAEALGSGTTYSLRAWTPEGASEATKVGFYTKTSGNLAGFKGWIKDSSSEARTFTVVFGGDTPTDIEGLTEALGLENGNVEIYDMNGRKLQSIQKGINIVNGKKVIK